MGNSQGVFNKLEVPSVDLTWLALSGDDVSSGDAVVLIPGGTGTGAKGGENQIQVAKNVDLKNGFEFAKSLETRNVVCAGVVAGVCSGENVVCAFLDNTCALLVANKNGADVSVKKVVEFKADFSQGGIVHCASILPSGHVVTGGDDAVLRLWNISLNKKTWSVKPLVQMDGHTAPVTSVSFHPNDALVSTVARDGSCKLWNVVSGKIIKDVPFVPRLSGGSPVPNAQPKLEYKDCLFANAGAAQSGSFLFTIQSTDHGAIYLIEWRLVKVRTNMEPKLSRKLRLYRMPSTRMKLSDSGAYLAIGNTDGSVTVIDVDSFQVVMAPKPHTSEVTGVSFAPDETAEKLGVQELLVSCSTDNKLHLTKMAKSMLGRAKKGQGKLGMWCACSTWMWILLGMSNFRRGTVSSLVAGFISFLSFLATLVALVYVSCLMYFME